MFCTKCGSELPEGVRHCYVCGAAVRQLPPLRTGQAFPAGQGGQNTPAQPASGLSGLDNRPAQPQGGPAYQAPSSPAYRAPAYQGLPSQGLPRPAWPPRSPEDAPEAPPVPGPAYAAGFAQSATADQQDPPQGAARPYSADPPSPPAYQYSAYYHAADTPDTVSMLDWLLSTLLVLFVPLVRLIMLFIWAFSVDTKPSKRNWARAVLILFAVFFTLFFALCVYYAAADPAFLYG